MTLEYDETPAGTLHWHAVPFGIPGAALPAAIPVLADPVDAPAPGPEVAEQGATLVVDVPAQLERATLHARSGRGLVEVAALGAGRHVLAASRLNGFRTLDVRAPGAATRTFVRGRGARALRVLSGTRVELAVAAPVPHTTVVVASAGGEVLAAHELGARALLPIPAPCLLGVFVEDHGGRDGRVIEIGAVSPTGELVPASPEAAVAVTRAVLAAKVPYAVDAVGRNNATLRTQERVDAIALHAARSLRLGLRAAMANAWRHPRGITVALFAAEILRRAGRAAEVVAPTAERLADLDAHAFRPGLASLVGEDLLRRMHLVGFSAEVFSDAVGAPTDRLEAIAAGAAGDASSLRARLQLDDAAERARACDGAFADPARNERARRVRDAIGAATPSDVERLRAEVAGLEAELAGSEPVDARLGADVPGAPRERAAHTVFASRVEATIAARRATDAAMVRARVAEPVSPDEAVDAAGLARRARAAVAAIAVDVPAALPFERATAEAVAREAAAIAEAAGAEMSDALAADLRALSDRLAARAEAWAAIVDGAATIAAETAAAHPHRRLFGARPRPSEDAARIVEALEAGAVWTTRPRDLGAGDDALSSLRADHPEVKAKLDAHAARLASLEGSGVELPRAPAWADDAGPFAERLQRFWAFLRAVVAAGDAIEAEVGRVERVVAAVLDVNGKLLTWVALARGALDDPLAHELVEGGMRVLLDPKQPGAFAVRKRVVDRLALHHGALDRLAWAALQAIGAAFPRARAELAPVLAQETAVTELWLRAIADASPAKAPPFWAEARRVAREHPWLPKGPAARQRATAFAPLFQGDSR